MPSLNAPWINVNRRVVRAPVNPLDKSTVVSIYPKFARERNPTIQPGVFDILPGSYDNPSVLIIGPSSWWREIDEDQPMLEIPNSSIQIADSIIKDYFGAMLCANGPTCMPGVFYLMGPKTVMQVKVEHKAELDFAREGQKNWYAELVKMADVLWSRSNGNPLSISDDMRLAAQELNLKEKPWLADFTTMTLINCPACGSLVRPGYPICANCKTIVDNELFKKMNLVQAK